MLFDNLHVRHHAPLSIYNTVHVEITCPTCRLFLTRGNTTDYFTQISCIIYHAELLMQTCIINHSFLLLSDLLHELPFILFLVHTAYKLSVLCIASPHLC